jgi:hypothetical protein
MVAAVPKVSEQRAFGDTMIFSRFYLKLTSTFVVIFLIVNLTARALGTTQPPNPALRGFTEGCEDKPQPCWYGIVPGQTDLPIAEQTVIQQGYQIGQNQSDRSIEFIGNEVNDFRRIILWRLEGHVEAVSLLYPTYMQLGDAIAVLGVSFGISSIFHAETIGLAYPDETFSITLDWNTISLHERETIAFLLTAPYVNSPPPLRPWHGFVPKWRYCQLEPDFTACAN